MLKTLGNRLFLMEGFFLFDSQSVSCKIFIAALRLLTITVFRKAIMLKILANLLHNQSNFIQ